MEVVTVFSRPLSNLSQCKSPKRNLSLLSCRNAKVFFWVPSKKHICYAPVSNLENNSFQILSPLIPPAFEVEAIKINYNSTFILLYGPNGLGAIKLPKTMEASDEFQGGMTPIQCNFTPLDQSYFSDHATVKVTMSDWYPGSPNGKHVLALTSDNCIRFYDITLPEQPMMRLPLFGKPMNPVSNNSGELAVDFDVGHPLSESKGPSTYPLYVMQKKGDVWVLYCKFTQNRLDVEVQGPLPVNISGTGNDYCNIVCMPSTPTTLVMVNENGMAHHCLVLPNQGSDDDFGDFNPTIPLRESLYMQESIQLSLNQSKGTTNEKGLQETSNLFMNGDSEYISVSKRGIQAVHIPWLQHVDSSFLGNTAAKPQMSIPSKVQAISHSCISDGSVLGCSALQSNTDFSTVLVITSSGELACLQLKPSLKRSNSESVLR